MTQEEPSSDTETIAHEQNGLVPVVEESAVTTPETDGVSAVATASEAVVEHTIETATEAVEVALDETTVDETPVAQDLLIEVPIETFGSGLFRLLGDGVEATVNGSKSLNTMVTGLVGRFKSRKTTEEPSA
ncbi:MAG: hypothetical protein HQL50_10310 [Magnetococcales bacterium]|nr:hypothetical protein [Magnetococcales bacterium]